MSSLSYIFFAFFSQVQIVGGPDIYVREGSSVTLECIVAESSNPVYIAWQFNRGDVPGSRLSVLGKYSTVSL
jgi:hypothetical protein